jgi:hypothetical protein
MAVEQGCSGVVLIEILVDAEFLDLHMDGVVRRVRS